MSRAVSCEAWINEGESPMNMVELELVACSPKSHEFDPSSMLCRQVYAYANGVSSTLLFIGETP